MSKFTKGPWEKGVDGNGRDGYIYCDDSLGSAVAIVYGKELQYSLFSKEEKIANANLIAAAPDMYEAADYSADVDLLTAKEFIAKWGEKPDVEKATQLCVQALAKARGEGTL